MLSSVSKSNWCACVFAGWGRVINISSLCGLVGLVNAVSYVATKHGLVGLTKVFITQGRLTGKYITVQATKGNKIQLSHECVYVTYII